MTVLFAATALLPDRGWVDSVRVAVGEDGRIRSVETGCAPGAGDQVLTGAILLPAPCNLHCHAFQRAMAGMTEGRGPAGSDSFWTWRTLMYRFLDRLTPEHVEAIAAMVYVEMLEAGYAGVGEFHYLHHQPGGADFADQAEMSARIAAAAEVAGIGLTLLPVLYMQGGIDGRPLEGGQKRFGCDPDRFLRLWDAARAAVAPLPADTGLGVAPHSLRAVSADGLRAVLDLQPGPIHIHVAEQVGEVDEIRAHTGATPVRHLLDIAPVDRRWCTIHATHMTDDEVVALAASGATVGLCPITEANLGDGIFPASRFLGAGGRFGIGSDSAVRIALAEELRTLEYSQRYRDRGRAVLASASASTGRVMFETAASGGARAIGRNSGSIAAGNWADLVAVDAEAVALAGLCGDSALDGWVFAGDDRVVRDVWSAGRHLVRDGRHRRRQPVEAAYRRAVSQLREAL